MSGLVRLIAAVDPAERPAMAAAAQQLAEALTTGAGEAWQVSLATVAPGARFSGDGEVVIASLLPEAARADEPIELTEARWRGRLIELGGWASAVTICTVFRLVSDRGEAGRQTLQRIRRLNLMAVRLSHELGVGVADLDRALAWLGARRVGTDYRLRGSAIADEVAGHAVAWALLSCGLDAVVDPQLQMQAKAVLGDLHRIDALLARRLGQAAHG
ncbi:MAG TPA: hypothetical protein VGL58_07330 [Caulobacteraceae bacterium]|jgi:hypothetical protein